MRTEQRTILTGRGYKVIDTSWGVVKAPEVIKFWSGLISYVDDICQDGKNYLLAIHYCRDRDDFTLSETKLSKDEFYKSALALGGVLDTDLVIELDGEQVKRKCACGKRKEVRA